MPAAEQLWSDIDFTRSMVIRTLFSFFERDQWRADSVAGRKLLTGLLCTLADNKIVEDLHGDVRKESRSNPNAKLTPVHIQEILCRSSVLEARGINHAAKPTRDSFSAEFRATKWQPLTRKFYCQKHKMSPRWIQIAGRRSWKSLYEEGSHQSQAAWQWLLNRTADEALECALFSKLVQPFIIILKQDANGVEAAWASLGNACWAVLAWPLVPASGGQHRYAFSPRCGATWIHITNPSAWRVAQVQGCMSSEGIVMDRLEEPMPLIRYFATTFPDSAKLSFKDVVRIAVHLGIDNPGGNSRAEILKLICAHFGDEYVPRKRTEQKQGLSASWLDAAVFEDLDKTEQLEFKDIAKEISKNKDRESAAAFRFVEAKKRKAKKNEPGAGAGPKKKARKSKKKSAAQAEGVGEEESAAAAPHQHDEGEAPGADDAVAAADDEVMPPPVIIAPAPAPPPDIAAAVAVPPAMIAPAPAPPPEMAAAVAVPPAAPGARGPIMRHNEGYLSWEDVQCGGCQAIVGQIKLETLPGGRDAPVWHMRVKENDGTWAQRNPKRRSARTSVVGDAPDWAKEWCQVNRGCGCAQ